MTISSVFDVDDLVFKIAGQADDRDVTRLSCVSKRIYALLQEQRFCLLYCNGWKSPFFASSCPRLKNSMYRINLKTGCKLIDVSILEENNGHVCSYAKEFVCLKASKILPDIYKNIINQAIQSVTPSQGQMMRMVRTEKNKKRLQARWNQLVVEKLELQKLLAQVSIKKS